MPRSRKKRKSERVERNKDVVNLPMVIRIDAQHEQEMQATMRHLYAREYERCVIRDAEFVKFLKESYIKCCPSLSPQYVTAGEDTFKECASLALQFTGVAKRSDSENLLVRSFTMEEGKSWADQRRAKFILPLCLSWLKTLVAETDRMREELNDDSPTGLLDKLIVELLARTYHPITQKSNVTRLVCTQTMHHKDFRRLLGEISNIVLPEKKKEILKWVADALEHGIPYREMSLSKSPEPESFCDVDVDVDLDMPSTILEGLDVLETPSERVQPVQEPNDADSAQIQAFQQRINGLEFSLAAVTQECNFYKQECGFYKHQVALRDRHVQFLQQQVEYAARQAFQVFQPPPMAYPNPFSANPEVPNTAFSLQGQSERDAGSFLGALSQSQSDSQEDLSLDLHASG